VAREAWCAPADWTKPAKPVTSWYDMGARLRPPVASWHDKGIRLAPSGWGLVPRSSGEAVSPLSTAMPVTAEVADVPEERTTVIAERPADTATAAATPVLEEAALAAPAVAEADWVSDVAAFGQAWSSAAVSFGKLLVTAADRGELDPAVGTATKAAGKAAVSTMTLAVKAASAVATVALPLAAKASSAVAAIAAEKMQELTAADEPAVGPAVVNDAPPPAMVDGTVDETEPVDKVVTAVSASGTAPGGDEEGFEGTLDSDDSGAPPPAGFDWGGTF